MRTQLTICYNNKKQKINEKTLLIRRFFSFIFIRWRFAMKETIKLQNPIHINDKEVKEICFDTDEITAQMFAQADANRKTSVGSASMTGTVFEVDYTMHLYLGFMAIIAVNPEFDVKDLERLKGIDVIAVTRIGRNFITRSSVERSSLDNSEDVSETTQKPSTLPLEKSEIKK